MIWIMNDSLEEFLPDPLNRLPSSAFRLHTIDREKTLFRQGAATRGLFFLLDGAIHLQRVTEAGHEVMVLKAVPGETFAEASLFHRSYHCSAVATKHSKVIECAKPAVIMRYREDPEFALTMCERFAHQVQHTRARLELYSIRSADDRVFRAVLDGMLKGSVKSLAHEIGLSPEVVYRSLASLTQSGRIQKVGYGQYEA
jgi:CRP-like cAMP-binding protein